MQAFVIDMGDIRNLKAAGWNRKARILAAAIISTVYAVIGISLTANAAQTLPVKYIGTDIVPAKYKNFILDMSDYPLSNATMESGMIYCKSFSLQNVVKVLY